jgi:VWFA-related protein
MARSRSVHSLALIPMLALVAGLVGHAQRPPQQAQRTAGGESSEVRAILIDVVVRDKEGNPVTDLAASDFELFEDGVKQEIGSMTPVIGPQRPAPRAGNASNGASTPPASTAPATPAQPAAPQVIALVFDRLTPEARAFARKAALGYVGEGATANNTIAVFGVDLSLILFQPFTRDASLLRKSISTAGERASSQYGSTRSEGNAAQQQATHSAQQANDATTNAASTGGANVASAAQEAQFAQMQSQMIQQFGALERDQQGYATSNALMAIVSALKAIPGRKSVIFFSEGLSIPPNVQRQFISVIDAANKANVSIYPMDAAGLRTESPLKETQEGINAASRTRMDGTLLRDDQNRPMTEALERNEDLLRADPHSGLGTLADQTGGFLIANSNDLRGGFERIDVDMRNYYVLTYVPKNTRFDGKFREVDVKVRRPGVQVRARKGYFAVRETSSGAPTLNYEAPAMAVLEQSPPPNAFPVRAVALRFPEAKRVDLVPVLVNVPIGSMTFRESGDKKSFGSDFTVLVRFKDDAGVVVDKVSQHYQLAAPADQLDRAKSGDVLFYREPVLYPGVFTMETVVYDAFASKASVRVQTVDVNALDAKALRMSTVVSIRRVEKVPASEKHDEGPLYVGDQLLYPNMGEPFSKASFKELPFYFVTYPTAGGGATTATIELLNNGTRVAQAPLQLSAADAKGHIAQLSHIPIDALQPGNYELRVTVQQGSQRVARVLPFKVAP